MEGLYERVAAERRRLREVRMALTQATGQGAQGDIGWAPFYIAIGDYFEAAMERLHEQDIRMGDMLREKADMQNPDNIRALEELDERLSGNQQHLTRMLEARDALRTGADGAIDAFEQAGGEYAAFIVANMGHHPGTANLAGELFSAADWEHMTLASEAARQREAELHADVFAKVPSTLEIDFPAG